MDYHEHHASSGMIRAGGFEYGRHSPLITDSWNSTVVSGVFQQMTCCYDEPYSCGIMGHWSNPAYWYDGSVLTSPSQIIIGVNMSSITRIIRDLPPNGHLEVYILLHIPVWFSLITRVLQVLACFVLVFFTKVQNFCIIPAQVLV